MRILEWLFPDRGAGFKLLVFTLITALLLGLLSVLTPGGRIYQHNQNEAAQHQRVLQQTRKQLPALQQAVAQLQQKKNALDKQAGNTITWPEDLIPPRRDLADDCDKVKDRIKALDRDVTGVANLQSRFNAIFDWANQVTGN